MNYFFYGTLRDPDVFKLLTGSELEGEAAILKGFETRIVKGHSYPVLIQNKDEEVDGIFVKLEDKDVIKKVEWFEEDYFPETVDINNKEAIVFGRSCRLKYTQKAYDFREWQLKNKDFYLEEVKLFLNTGIW